MNMSTSGKESVPLSDNSSEFNEVEMENVLHEIHEFEYKSDDNVDVDIINTNDDDGCNNPNIDHKQMLETPEHIVQATSTTPVPTNEDESDDDHSDRFNVSPHQHPSPQKLYSAKIFLQNKYFYARLIIIAVTTFLMLLSILYAFGNLLSLELANYSCNKRTLEEVEANSKERGWSKGDIEGEGCWKTKGFTVNEQVLWSSESYSYGYNWSTKAILKSIAFSIVAIMFLSLSIFYIRILIVDVQKYRKHGRFTRDSQNKKAAKLASFSLSSKSNVFSDLIDKILAIFAPDSGPWIAKEIIKEIIEIITQSSALLYYNGYYNDVSQGNSDVTLAHDPKLIMLFTGFISMNCVLTSILWLLYAFKPLFCHGLLFHGVLYSIDATFDIFYALYPILVVSQAQNQDNLTTLASLNTDEGIAFWVVWIPLLLLCWSSFALSRKIRRAMSADIRIKNLEIGQLKRKQTPSKGRAMISKLVSASTRKLVTSSNYVINSANNKKNVIRKIVIVLTSLLFAVYGIYIFTTVIIHFDESKTYCQSVMDETNKFAETLVFNNSNTLGVDNIIQQRMKGHPELFLWEECKFKVYPFTIKDYTCQCRQFETNWDRFNIMWNVDELRMKVDIELIDILRSILKQWYMLEKLRWEDTDILYKPNDPPKLSMTSDMFNAGKMRVFKLSATSVRYIDDAISNWKLLGYFSFVANDGINEFPDTFEQLGNLKYVSFGQLFTIKTFPIQICALSKLETLVIELTTITTIPHCVAKLDKLRSILLTLNEKLVNFPLGILQIDSLQELNVVSTAITWDALVTYNNITNITEFDESFEYNVKASYWFQLSDFCDEIENITSIKFIQWINETNSCEESCYFESALTAVICPSWLWQNGVCDEKCNQEACDWDGGDCIQLCDWNKCPEELLGNYRCDIQCNTTECGYDVGECIKTYTNDSYCGTMYNEGIHECVVEWVNDETCDSKCQFVEYCGYDGNDCNNCVNNECFNAFALFDIGANSLTNDNHIDSDEICIIWAAGIASGLFDPMIEQKPELANCSIVIPSFDLNNDEKLNLYETIVGMYLVFNTTLEKALQINCSMCVGTKDYYN